MGLGLYGHIRIFPHVGPKGEIGRDVYDARLVVDPACRAGKRLLLVPKGREGSKLLDLPLLLGDGIHDVLDGVMDAGFCGIEHLWGLPFSPCGVGLDEDT